MLATVIAGGTGYWVVRQEPIMYQSKVTLMIGRPFESLNPDSSQLWLSQLLAETYAGFAQREPVRNATMEALDIDWLPQYSAYVPPRTQFIEIFVIDTDPARTQLVANELANQLIQLSPTGEDNDEQQRQLFIDEQLDELQGQIEQTKAEIETKQQELGELFSAREISETQGQIAALQDKLNTLQLNYATLLSNSDRQATNALTIIEPAQYPQWPTGPNNRLTIVLAAAFGATLAAGAAYLLEFLSDTVETPDDLKRLANVLTLATIPFSSSLQKVESEKEIFVLQHPRSPETESYRHLRTSVRFLTPNGDSKTFLISSADAGEGKSTTATNLAVVFAQAGFKTLLIDGDLRRPTLHNNFSLSNHSGLTNLILKLQTLDVVEDLDKTIGDFVHKVPELDLYVLPSGLIPPNPAEVLGSLATDTIISYARRHFDYVFIDTPPTLLVTDAVTVAPSVDSVILVVQAKRTRRKSIKQTIDRLNEVRANVIGVVLNQVAKSSHQAYYYDQKNPYINIPSESDYSSFVEYVNSQMNGNEAATVDGAEGTDEVATNGHKKPDQESETLEGAAD